MYKSYILWLNYATLAKPIKIKYSTRITSQIDHVLFGKELNKFKKFPDLKTFNMMYNSNEAMIGR